MSREEDSSGRPGEQFRKEFRYDLDSRTSSIVSRDPEVIQRHRMFMEEHFRIHDQGWQPATIINMHPRPLEHNMGYMGHIRVPARPNGQLYYRYLLEEYRIDSRDLGGAKYAPVPYMPIQLAKDFVRQFAEMGGVLCYEGDRPPRAEELEPATERLLEWYRRIFRAAQDQWSRRPQRSMIDDHMRSAAKTLLELGEVDKLPEWVDETKKEARAHKKVCPQCGNDVKTAAKICTYANCGFVFDEEFYTQRGFVVVGGLIVARPSGLSPVSPQVSQNLQIPEAVSEVDGKDFTFRSDTNVPDLSKFSSEPLKKKEGKK